MLAFGFATLLILLLATLQCRGESSRGNCSCGIGSAKNEFSKIIGGVRVQDGEYPWRVALFEKSTTRGKRGLRFFCAGTLISPEVILTAAHCVATESRQAGADRDIYTAIGHTDIGGLERADLARVARVVQHERFRNMLGVFSSFQNDIALLFLEKPVNFSDTVRAACLPFANAKELSGTKVSASGWGRLTEKDESANTYMYAVDLNTYTPNECRLRFFTVSLLINSNVFCAHDVGKDTCKGDSGGSVDLLEDGRMYSVGVVSWGWGCARRSSPGIYTKVADYLDWIVNNSPGVAYCGQPQYDPHI